MAKFKINLSFLKNKNVIGATCIVVGIVFGFVLIPVATGLSGTEVVRAAVPIPEGTQIKGNMLKQVHAGALNLQPGTYHNIGDTVGKYATTDIGTNDNLTSSKVSKSNPEALQPGQMEMSVAIKNFASGLSGKLQAGDVVSVFCPQSVVASVNSGSTVEPAIYPPELQYVRVKAVTASTGKDTNPANYQNTSSTNTNSSDLPASVTLIVTTKQAAILAGMDNLNVHLALVCHGSDSRVKGLLQQQEDELNSTAITALPSSSPTSSSTTTTSSGVTQ